LRLSADDLRALARVIERIDDGKAPPRVGGPVGLFFRQYARFRREVAHVLARAGVATAADGHIQGADLGSIEMTPLSSVYTAIPNDLWGPVAHVPMVCEELVHVIDLTLWLNARAANEVDRLLSVDQVGAVRLAGSYRWHAPHRVTPGEASPEPAQTEVRWHDARCLKATADDLASPPHPLEYTIDFRLGPPGVKTFRSFVARYVPERTRVDVLPGRGARTLPIALELPRGSLRELRGGGLVMVLGFREPWDGDWTVVAADAVDKTTALAHALTWADFRLEVEGSPPLADADTLELTAALRAAGVAVSSVGAALDRATLVRCGLPAALAVARWLRART
jgi:hypothetical protein